MRRKGAANGAELPQPLPAYDAERAELTAWVSKALPEPVASTWRPSQSQHAALLVRFASGRELFFDTVADACRPEHFGAAVIAITGRPMAGYSKAQLQMIVAALIRMATLEADADDRDFWADTGATFLRACLTTGNVQEVQLDADCEEGRLELYRAASRYSQHLGTLADDEFPRVLVAADRATLLIPRGAFLAFAQRRSRGSWPGTVNAQMQRLEWWLCDLRPRKPGAARDYPRPHLRLWEISSGWEGLVAEGGNLGPGTRVGLRSTRAPAPGRAPVEKGPSGTQGFLEPND